MAVFTGNRVPYGNGGHWYVQLVVTDAGGNSGTSTTVWYTYQVVFENSVSDSSNTISWDDPWGHGEANNFRFSGAGTYTVGGTFSNAATIQWGGGNYLNFRFYATGMAGAGGASEININYYLPARWASPPSPPTIAARSDASTHVAIWTTVAGAENGATTQKLNYRLHRNADGAHIGDLEGGYNGVNFWGLQRVTDYVAFAQSYNAAGWGGWSTGVGVRTQADPPSKPTFVVEHVGPQSMRIKFTLADIGGVPITSWGHQGTETANGSDLAQRPVAGVPFSGNTATLTYSPETGNPLQPGKKYYFRARAQNQQKVGEWSDMVTIETLAGAWITVDGVKKLAVPYVNVGNGEWKIAVPYVNVNGIWRPVSG